MSEGKIAVVHEYDGGFVGTNEEVIDYIFDQCWNLADCRFYDVGNEITPEGFKFKDTE